jgi:hypothetical protein
LASSIAAPARLALDLAGHREQVDEHADLGAQHDRLDRLEDIVDRAHRIAADQMLVLLVDRRQEDDRDALGLGRGCRMIWRSRSRPAGM